jgi:hypothetical protein
MKRFVAALAVMAAVGALMLAAPAARADNPSREAGKHFQRGVDLYGDGDFRGALVEFKKAYAVWPRANVLYDIGQTEFQLLDYAEALKTMERYLAETGPNAAHRSEVEATVETLRGRVGKVALITDAVGCDVSVDEQPVGSTPLDGPLLVSIGTRRIAVTCPGRAGASGRVEVAAGDTVRLELKVPAPAPAAMRGAALTPVKAQPHVPDKNSYIVGWVVTGVLLVATVGVGSATLVEQSHLEAMKRSFPVTKADLDRQSALTTGLAISSDVLGVATLAAAATSTWLTIKYGKEMQQHHKLRVGVAPGAVVVSGRF